MRSAYNLGKFWMRLESAYRILFNRDAVSLPHLLVSEALEIPQPALQPSGRQETSRVLECKWSLSKASLEGWPSILMLQ